MFVDMTWLSFFKKYINNIQNVTYSIYKKDCMNKFIPFIINFYDYHFSLNFHDYNLTFFYHDYNFKVNLKWLWYTLVISVGFIFLLIFSKNIHKYI